MKGKKSFFTLLLLWFTPQITISQDLGKIMDFQPVKFKYFEKAPTKKVFFYQFDIGYVVQSYARHGGADIMPMISGLTQEDLQRITNRIYSAVVEQWENAGYEVLDLQAMQASGKLKKLMDKGKCRKNEGSFSLADEVYQFGEQAFVSGKYKGQAEQTVAYFNPTGHLTVDGRGQAQNLNATMQYAAIGKELNAIAINLHLKFDFVDYSGQVTYGSDKIYSTVSGSPVLSADNFINMNYTTPKGYMATAMMDNDKGEVYGGSGYLLDIENLGDCVRNRCPERVLLGQSVKTNRLFLVNPDTYANDVTQIAGRIMQYFLEQFGKALSD